MAATMVRSVIAMLACMLSRSPQFVLRNYSGKKNASMYVFLIKAEVQE